MSKSMPTESIDVLLFRRNRNQFPDELLQPYWGKQVAWSGDGTRIVASGDDQEQLYERLVVLGIHPTAVVDEFIHDPNVSYFGLYRVLRDREIDQPCLALRGSAMSNSLPIEPIDVLLFRRNRDQFPDEQLQPYWGKQVAWTGDGTRIVASGESDEDLHRHLNALGIHPASVVIEFIYHPDVSYF